MFVTFEWYLQLYSVFQPVSQSVKAFSLSQKYGIFLAYHLYFAVSPFTFSFKFRLRWLFRVSLTRSSTLLRPDRIVNLDANHARRLVRHPRQQTASPRTLPAQQILRVGNHFSTTALILTAIRILVVIWLLICFLALFLVAISNLLTGGYVNLIEAFFKGIFHFICLPSKRAFHVIFLSLLLSLVLTCNLLIWLFHDGFERRQIVLSQ